VFHSGEWNALLKMEGGGQKRASYVSAVPFWGDNDESNRVSCFLIIMNYTAPIIDIFVCSLYIIVIFSVNVQPVAARA
jgi:hypothetical protein